MPDDFRVTDEKLVYTREELAGEGAAEITTRRPTLTRVAGGLLLGGLPGALLGFAWRKKDRQRIRRAK